MNSLRLRLLALAVALQRGLIGADEAAEEVQALDAGGSSVPQIPERLSVRLGAGTLQELERELQATGKDEGAAFRIVADSLPASSAWRRLWDGPAAAMEATLRALSRSTPPPGTRSVLPKERYQVRKELARGGMGRVLVAMDNLMGREVAIKEMLSPDNRGVPTRPATPGKSSGADFERFLREAKVTGQLEHPNIVPVYEIGQNPDGTVFYAMKYVRGQTFAERLWQIGRDPALRTAEDRMNARMSLLDAFVQVCHAVAYAHSRGVINRDLKPANLILGDFGETLVLDWGLARVAGQEDKAGRELLDATAMMSAGRAETEVAGGSSKLTVDGAVFGTPSYMPPEQARGRIDEVDEKSDVYALGGILYEILTAHAPYEGPNVGAILQSVLTVDPVPVRTHEPEAPKELAALAAKAMARDRALRLSSAKALAEEVKAFRDGRALESYQYSLGEQFSRFLRKHRALASAIAAAFVILVAGVFVSLYYAKQAGIESRLARAAERDANAARDKASQKAEDERRAREATQKALTRAQGERLAALAKPLASEFPAAALLLSMRAADTAPGLTSNNALYESLLHLSEARHFFWHDWGGRDAAWSPDNRRLATCGNDYLVRLWDLSTGTEIAHSDAHDGPVAGVAFSPDGRRLLSWSGDGTARLWDGETLRPVVTLEGHTRGIGGAKYSADGAVVLTWSGDGTARLWSLSSGTSLAFQCGAKELEADLSPDAGRIVAADGTGPALLWNTADPSTPRVLGTDGPSATLARFSPDGNSVATSGPDGQLRIWDAATGAAKSSWAIPNAGGARTHISWRPDGKRIVSCGRDALIVFQDADAGANAVTHKGPYQMSWGVSPDWTRFAASTERHQVEVHAVADGRRLDVLGAHEYGINEVRFSPDGKRVATISGDRTAIVWDVRPGRETPLLDACAGGRLLSPCPDGRTGLFRLDREGHVGVRDLESGETLTRWEDTLDQQWINVEVDPQGKFAAIVRSKAGMVELRELRTGRVVRRVEVEPGARNHATFNVSGTCLSCIGNNSQIVVLQLPGGETIGNFQHPKGAHTVDTSPDGKTTYTTLPPAAVIIAWETATGKELGRFTGHTGWTLSARALPDGRHIVSTAADASVRVWDTTKRAPIAMANWPRIEDITAIPSPDGNWIAVFVEAGEVRLLKTEGLQQHLVLPFVTSPKRLGFTTDSTLWLAPYADGTVRRIPLDLLAAAKRAVPRELHPSELARYEVGDDAERLAYQAGFLKAHPSALSSLMTAIPLARAGKFDDALAHARLSSSILPRHPDIHIFVAGIFAQAAEGAPAGSPQRRERVDEALAESRRALEHGKSVNDMRNEIEEPSVKDDPRFEAMLKEFAK
ncbi:MAG: protein kinase [Planctomycetota bacterium]